MKEFYHGTIKQFVPSILKDGLTPTHVEARWNATKVDFFSGYNPAKDDPMGYVYVLDWRGMASNYAKAKADYYKAAPGALFNTAHDVLFRKDTNAPVIQDAEPAVLKVTVPDTFPIELDNQDFDGFKFKGVIPPEYIKLVSYTDSIGVPRDHARDAEVAELKAKREQEIDKEFTQVLLKVLYNNKERLHIK